MDRTSGTSENLRDPLLAPASPKFQVIRAWILLLLGFIAFVALFLLAATNVHSYVMDGTQPRTATLERVSGQNLLVRSSSESEWRLVTERTTVSEGDMISTGSATTGWITLFDQGTVEVSENSVVRINRMRTSRLVRDRKEVDVEPIRGSIYVGMAPRGEFSSSVVRVATGPVSVRMRDEIRNEQTGSFLVEVQRTDPSGDEDDPLLSVRVAVLRGQADVETSQGARQLSADQQVVIDAGGHHGEVTTAMRELIRNGDFGRHLSDWVEFHDHAGDPVTDSGTVERVPAEHPDGQQGVAVQIRRSTTSGDNWESGIQQTIGQSLRVHSSLHLSLNLRIDEQRPPGGGDQLTEFPLIVKMNYVDLNGQNREWWHGFYIHEDLRNPVPEERGTRVVQGEWTPVQLDLRNLSPLPRQITSIIVYSSGHSYRTLVTDISLSSSETGDDEYD